MKRKHANHKKKLMKKLSRTKLRKNIPLLLFVLAFAGIGTSLLVLSRAATAVSSVKSGRWSDPTVWSNGRVPEVGDTTTIETAHTVTYDLATSPVLAETHVKGTLAFDPNKDSKLVTNKNMIVTGKLAMKPANADIEHFVQFTGIDERTFVGGGMTPLATDVGLWVMDAGQMDVTGTAKTSWTTATDTLSVGATTVTLKNAPTGWRIGDTIIITPTEAPTVGNASYTAVEEREITAISGNTVTFSNGLSRAHPKVNNMWTAEVGNLTRNVRIEGTSTKVTTTEHDAPDADDRHNGNSHIFIHSQNPQTISHAQLRYMGSAGADERVRDPMQQVKLGRYSLHFHHAGKGSTGSTVDGVVVRNANFHQFVPHASDGITMKNNIAYDNKSGAFWWDLHSLDPDSDSHHSVWDHNLVAKMRPRGDFAHSLGFFQPAGFDNKTLNNTYVGALGGNEDYGGYVWINSNIGVWAFDGNTAHNNNSSGMRVWQNSPHVHPITNFAFYHNKYFGMNHGAYVNDYNFVNGYVYGNEKGGLMSHANSNTAVQQRYENVVWDGAGISPNLIVVAESQLFHGFPILFRDNTFQNYTQHAVLMEGIGAVPKKLDIVNSTFKGPSPAILYGSDSSNPENVVRVQPKPGEGAPYQIKPGNVLSQTSAFAPSAHYGTGTGLLTEYFSGSNFSNRIFARLESTISNNIAQDYDIPPPWLEPWPVPFMMRWTGEYMPQEDASYVFTADEFFKARMWLNDQLVLDATNFHREPVVGTAIPLKAGQRYKLKVEGNFSTPDQGANTFYIFNLLMRKANEPASTNRVLPRTQLYCGSDPVCNLNSGLPFPTPPTTPPPSPPTPDTTAPTVSITAPANNATASGTLNVAANASDNVGVTQVEFLVDGQSRNTDTSTPYSFALSTTTLGLPNGTHTLTARARDAAGNITTSTAVTINVNNASSPPPPPPPVPSFPAEDINQDGRVNLLDFSILAARFGQTNNLGRADINNDGRVNLVDFSLLAARFGR